MIDQHLKSVPQTPTPCLFLCHTATAGPETWSGIKYNNRPKINSSMQHWKSIKTCMRSLWYCIINSQSSRQKSHFLRLFHIFEGKKRNDNRNKILRIRLSVSREVPGKSNSHGSNSWVETHEWTPRVFVGA